MLGAGGGGGGAGHNDSDQPRASHQSEGVDFDGVPKVVITYQLDITPPVITPTVTGTIGNNGWYTSNVGVSWSVIDAESPVTSTSGCSATTINTDTAGITLTCFATSSGGTASQSVTIKRDATPPEVAVTGPQDGATYVLGSSPDAGCTTTDSPAGVVTEATLTVSGGPLGSVTATCSGATDAAGNVGGASVTYAVASDFHGFFQPIDMDKLNTVNAGSAIPVKFSLGGSQGLDIFATGSPTSVQIDCDSHVPADAIEETVTAGSSSLSYDATTDQYVYVWKTDKAWANTCRQLMVTLADGSVHTAEFKFFK